MKFYVAIFRVDNLTQYTYGRRLLEFKFISDDSLRLFRYAAKLSWDKFIRDFQYINAICKVKIFLSDEENYKKCCHETSKQTNKKKE